MDVQQCVLVPISVFNDLKLSSFMKADILPRNVVSVYDPGGQHSLAVPVPHSCMPGGTLFEPLSFDRSNMALRNQYLPVGDSVAAEFASAAHVLHVRAAQVLAPSPGGGTGTGKLATNARGFTRGPWA